MTFPPMRHTRLYSIGPIISWHSTTTTTRMSRALKAGMFCFVFWLEQQQNQKHRGCFSSVSFPSLFFVTVSHIKSHWIFFSLCFLSQINYGFSKVTSTTSALRGGAAVAMGSSGTSLPPPVGTWIVPALACASGFALYNSCIKKSSATMDPILGGVVLQCVATLVGSLLLFYQRMSSTSSTVVVLQYTPMGLRWAIAAGLSVGAAELLSFVISGRGVPATQSIPVIVGGSILIGTILGAVWLQERLTRSGWVGVLLIAAGIALVGMNGTA
jgi:bacterial/archaeal transporter family protein